MADYGNNWKSVVHVAAVGAILGLLTVVIAVVGITMEGRWAFAHPEVLPLLFLGPVACLVIPVALTACFRVRIADGRVQHIFIGRFVLQDFPVTDFVAARWGSIAAMVLEFTLGRKIYLMGSHIRERERLAKDLYFTAGKESWNVAED